MNYLALLKQYPRYLSFGFLHYFFSFVGQTFFISLFVAGMTSERGWETDDLAVIYSGVTLCSALLLPTIGRQVDKLRVRYISTITALVMVSGCVILGLSSAWYWLPIGLLAVRMGGQGVMTLIGSTATGRFFTEGRGKALALVMIGIAAAEIIIAPVATLLIAAHGYRVVWLLTAGLITVVLIPAIWLLIRRHDLFQRAATVAEHQKEQVAVQSWTRGEVIRDRRFQLIVPTILFIPFFFTGFVFNQTDIAGSRAYTPEWMALGMSVYGLTRTGMIFSAGEMIDRFGASKLLPYALIPVTIGVLIFASFSGDWTVPVLFCFTAVSAGTLSVTAPALWADRYGPRYLGSIKSVVQLLIVFSSAAAPIVFSRGLQLGESVWLGIMIGYAIISMVLAFVEKKIE